MVESTTPPSTTPPNARMSRWIGIALLGYWCMRFTATHIPIETPKLPQNSDKLVHIVMYGGLSCLLSGWLTARGRRGLRVLAVVLAVTAVYGVVDELLQIPVGRHADVNDWLADCAGSLLGLTAMIALRRVCFR